MGLRHEKSLHQPVFFVMNKELLPANLYMPELGNSIELHEYLINLLI